MPPTRTRLGFLDEKGEHGRTITEFVEGLVLREDGASQNHALLEPLHFWLRHLDGEHVPVVGHDVTVSQDLVRKLSVTYVISDKGMGARHVNEFLSLQQRVCHTL